MDIIKTSMGLTRTIRNVSRFREILQVFAKHGFDQIIISSRLHQIIPNFVIPKSISKFSKESETDADFWQSLGTRLRLAFEELGPSFIKVGQLLATREDLFNPKFIEELKKLQNSAKAIDFTTVKRIIESNLEDSLDSVFESIEEVPIGVASIGMVYRAKLITGEDVVVKVQRPNIKKVILNDFEIMSFIVSNIEKTSDEIRFLGLSRVIDDFFKSIRMELNFLVEANNSQKLKNNLEKLDEEKILVIPKIYKEFSSDKILVMDFLDGQPFNTIFETEKQIELQPKLIKCVRYFLHTMLADGFFHADLHGGNFFLLKDGRIGLIDFGLVGNLSKKNRTNLVAILYALISNNYENLVYEFLDVADYENIPNHDMLTRDVRDSLTPFIGMSVQELDATVLTHNIVSALGKHQVYLPREWFIIFRALMTLDGVGKSLKVDLNIFEIIDDEISVIMKDLISKDAIIEDGLWLARDITNSIRIVPRHLSWALKELARKNYTIDINPVGVKEEINILARSLYTLGLLLVGSMFFLSGIFVVKDISIVRLNDVPLLAGLCWLFSMMSFVRAAFLFKLK